MPGSGTIPPEVFIPIAERYGLMIKLGRWVLRTACSQLAAWERAGLARELLVHVDLSAPELIDPDLVAVVCETLGESGVAPDRLCLEVTEASIRASGATAERTLHALDDIGVRLALDDFGTGSIDRGADAVPVRLREGLGRALIGGVDSPMQRERLIRGLLGMAKALGTTLIAEGDRARRRDRPDRRARDLEIQGTRRAGRPAGTALRRRQLDRAP